jgi:hypothetical protein
MAEAVSLLTWDEMSIPKMYIVLDIAESSERRRAYGYQQKEKHN